MTPAGPDRRRRSWAPRHCPAGLYAGGLAVAPSREVAAVSEVFVDARFHGPPHSANGGYVCGAVAGLSHRPVAVSLRVPPPLDRRLPADVDADGRVVLRDGDTVVGEAAPTEPIALDPPRLVTLDEASAAAERFVGFEDHPFPTCWVCGPRRPAGDGLHIFTGAVEGATHGLVAAPWTPQADVDDGQGEVLPEQVWAALDCPSYFGGVAGEPALLARMQATIAAPVRVGEPHVVLGWSTAATEGRKRHAASAILSEDGTVLATAAALWVTLSAEALADLLAPA